MLWNMAEADGAVNLLREMSIPGYEQDVSAPSRSPAKPVAAR
jgi:hypothetical protein